MYNLPRHNLITMIVKIIKPAKYAKTAKVTYSPTDVEKLRIQAEKLVNKFRTSREESANRNISSIKSFCS